MTLVARQDLINNEPLFGGPFNINDLIYPYFGNKENDKLLCILYPNVLVIYNENKYVRDHCEFYFYNKDSWENIFNTSTNFNGYQDINKFYKKYVNEKIKNREEAVERLTKELQGKKAELNYYINLPKVNKDK